MIMISHIANVLVTFAVVAALWRNTPGMDAAFGTDTSARRILGCVYGAIGLVSLYALAQMLFGNAAAGATVGAVLFPLQILYKLATVLAVGPRHPVVRGNLAIAVLHVATLLVAY